MVLSKIEVPPKATIDEIIASIITGKGTITFTSEDRPSGDVAHNNALYLSVLCLQKHVSLALVDNGLTVNVCH